MSQSAAVPASSNPASSNAGTATAAPAWNAAIADPGPLGLAAFAMTTFVLSAANSHLIPPSVEPVVFGLAFFYGGIVQLLAGMWEFVKGNTFGALAFSSYGAFWLSFWYLATHPELLTGADHANRGVGTFLLGWTIFTAYMLIASLRTSVALIGVFATLTVTFLLLTLGEYETSVNLTKAGGWVGLVTAVLAWYASFAAVTNSTNKRTILPVFPLG